MNGTRWDVERIVKVIDGDTIRLIRSRTVRLDNLELTARDAGNGVLARLAWVDTPERGHERFRAARFDLAGWVARHGYDDDGEITLTVVCFDGGAGWDRILVDLQDADGNSASQWMLRERGWPAYQPGGAR